MTAAGGLDIRIPIGGLFTVVGAMLGPVIGAVAGLTNDRSDAAVTALASAYGLPVRCAPEASASYSRVRETQS